MTTRNSRSFVLSIAAALASFLLHQTAFAAPAADVKPAQSNGQCQHYARTHHGHPGKGVDVVKLVYVDCSTKH